jgi:hypothetical protein
MTAHGHLLQVSIASCLGRKTMTFKASQAFSTADDDLVFERDHPPVPLWFAGTVVVMNVLSAVMSLMA